MFERKKDVVIGHRHLLNMPHRMLSQRLSAQTLA
jgi:hypothetical protein